MNPFTKGRQRCMSLKWRKARVEREEIARARQLVEEGAPPEFNGASSAGMLPRVVGFMHNYKTKSP